MKCPNHPEEEALEVCTICGKNFCKKCKQAVSDGFVCISCSRARLKAAFSGNKAITKSVIFILLPILMGIVGGLISFLMLRKKVPELAFACLSIGSVVTIIAVSLPTLCY